MSGSECDECRQLLSGLSDDKQQAYRVDEIKPQCLCEAYSVGTNSPGRIQDQEVLYRLVITPGDLDQHGNLLVRALKDAEGDGLSLFREIASNAEVAALVADRLSRKQGTDPKTVHSLIRVKTENVRSLTNPALNRLFCVYDETVPRRDPTQTPVPTHATILQRLYEKGTANRGPNNAQVQKRLYDTMIEGQVDVGDFRDGILRELNTRSKNDEFIRDK